MMKLWCYNHRRPTNAYFSITVSPSATVDNCKKTVLQSLKLAPPAYLITLYKIPQTHPVPLEDIESTLGVLSISDLGKELPPHMTMQQIFTDSLEGHLHLVVVERGTPLPVCFYLPSTQRLLVVDVMNRQLVSNFLPAIEAQDPTLKGNIVFYKTLCTRGMFQELRGTIPKGQLLNSFSNLYTAFDDVPFSKSACITVEAVHPARKHALSVRNAEECRKRQALTGVAPSQVDVSHFLSVQSKYHERIYDYRMPFGHAGPLPEISLPPIEVLFDGFGRFLEIWRAASATNFDPDPDPHPDPLDPDDRDPLYIRIEKFVAAMSQVYGDEITRSTAVLATLNKIFPPKPSRHSIILNDIPRTSSRSATGSPPRTGGIARYKDIIPCILVECKNEAVAKCIPIGELVAYYKLIVDQLCTTKSKVVDGSRLPTLGITIIGNSITFYALAYVCSTVCLPLTASLWCIPIESGGSDRYQLYAAFKAATVLLECIGDEAKRLLDGSGVPTPINRPRLPQLKRLRRYHDPSDYIEFQIEDILAVDSNRHVYLASSSILDSLVVKLTRSYSAELHAFCADLGRAPKLYAYEKLPGGIIATAMAYVEGDILEPSSDPVLQDKWIIAMKDLVEKIHEKGFVHGDLRPPNFMIVKDEVILLDFDWGGQVGIARYPPVPLHPVLSKGRATHSLDITQQDDERILKHTIEYIRGGGTMMEV